jgi:hypothetical protein
MAAMPNTARRGAKTSSVTRSRPVQSRNILILRLRPPEHLKPLYSLLPPRHRSQARQSRLTTPCSCTAKLDFFPKSDGSRLWGLKPPSRPTARQKKGLLRVTCVVRRHTRLACWHTGVLHNHVKELRPSSRRTSPVHRPTLLLSPVAPLASPPRLAFFSQRPERTPLVPP